MDKTTRSKRPSGQDVPDPAGDTLKAYSKQAGERGEHSDVYVNQRGQVCYGNNCVTLTIDAERNEVVVNIKHSPKCKIDPLVEALRKTMGEGARTVYELESEVREK